MEPEPTETMQADSPLPVVVLSGGVTALGVMRAFGRRGIDVSVHPETLEVIRHSRWYRPLLPPGTPSAPPSAQALRDVLRQSGHTRAFLCACSDDWNRALAEFNETEASAEDRFVSSVPSRAALDRLQDKSHLAELLRAEGVPMPLTRRIDDAADLAELPTAGDTFYFLKPTDSQRFLVRFGTKGMRVPDVQTARRKLEEIVAAGLSVVLQEYIPGPCTGHYFVDGYRDRAGEIKGLFARRRLRIYPPDFGNSTAMVSVPLDDVAQAVDSVQRVLGAVAYRGIFSAEFKRDPRDGLFKLLEVNTRPWWFIDFAVRCGVDVCRMAYDDAQRLPVRRMQSYRIGATCVYPYYDFFALQPLRRAGKASWAGWLGELLPALQPVGCMDDPMPGAVGFTRIVGAAMRKRIGRSSGDPGH